MNKITIWIFIILITLGVLFVFGGSSTKISIEPPFEAGVLHPLDNTKGNQEAKVVLMEYSDFQCPACRSYYPILKQLSTEFSDSVLFIYRHFPLLSIHPNAEFASRASESARKQGKFWEMHDLLYEKQNEWARTANVLETFESYATLLLLDTDQFKTDFSSQDVVDFVRAQRIHATGIGLQGTPSFFLNGRQIQNPQSYEEFKKIILEELNK